MSQEIENKGNKVYYTVIEGTLRTRVEESHPQAKKREVEMEDGSKKVKWEREVGAIAGRIEDIYIQDGKFGQTVNITLDANTEGKNPVVQLNIENGRYGEDFLKKLPNIKLSDPVTLRPFSFTPEGEDKNVQGLEIKQNDKKIENYFWDKEKKKPLNGFPELEKKAEDMDKNDWKIHFLKARQFVVKYASDKILPKFRATQAEKEAPADYPQEDINPEDIPF